MKEKPIIFSTSLIPSILNGSKTQTRRVIIPKLKKLIHDWDNAFVDSAGYKIYVPVRLPEEPDFSDCRVTRIYCPYEEGDTLWVRESFYTESGDIWYKADGQTAPMPIKWKPSIFMPRWASRITLEITEIRIERLNQISESDVKSEGVPSYTLARGCLANPPQEPRWKFIELWDSIYKKYPWSGNSFVWVLSFERLKEKELPDA